MVGNSPLINAFVSLVIVTPSNQLQPQSIPNSVSAVRRIAKKASLTG